MIAVIWLVVVVVAIDIIDGVVASHEPHRNDIRLFCCLRGDDDIVRQQMANNHIKFHSYDPPIIMPAIKSWRKISAALGK